MEPKKDDNKNDDQGRPVEVNMNKPEESRDLKKPEDPHEQSHQHSKAPTSSPALDDEEIDHSPESDFSHSTQKSGIEHDNRQI